jgi:molecular chaperone GrpE (heat shock protein)
MAVPDKVEAVKKVTETLSKQPNPIDEMERLAPNKEHFDSLMHSSQPIKSSSFERIDTKAFATEEVQSIETKPVFAEENVSAQKGGTATDQERKQRQQQIEEVEGVAATSSKKSTSKSASLMDEISKLHKNVSSISSASPDSIKTQAKDAIAQIENIKTQLSQTQTEIRPSYQTVLRNRLTHIDDNLKIALNKAGIEYTPPQVTTDTGNHNPIHKFISFLTNSQHQLENLNVAIDQFNVTGQISPANMLAIQMKMGYVQQQIELFTSLLNKVLESTKTIMNVQV